MAGVNWRQRHTAARESIMQGRSHIFDKTMDMMADLDDFPHDRWYGNASATGDGTGKSWQHAFTTITAAIDAADDDDIIYLTGAFTENISYTSYAVGPSRIALVGADYGFNYPQWQASGNTVSMIDLNCVGWTIKGFRFVPPNSYPGIRLTMTTAAGGAYGTRIIGNSFTNGSSTTHAVQLYGAPFHVEITDNFFDYIGSTGGAALGTPSGGTSFACPFRCRIIGNIFTECTNQIDFYGANSCLFMYNVLQGTGHGKTTVKHLFMTAANSNDNIVTLNHLGGDYSTASNSYVGGSGDDWSGNFCEDNDESEVGDNSISINPPAAA